MFLTYRGIRYHAPTTAIFSPRTKAKAKYRGQTYQISQPITATPSKLKLISRGITYYRNQPVATQMSVNSGSHFDAQNENKDIPADRSKKPRNQELRWNPENFWYWVD